MTSVPGVDHPMEQTEAELTVNGRGVSVTARVEMVQDDRIAVRPSVGELSHQVVVEVGDAVDIFWQHGDSRRALPAEVTAVQQGAVIRWQLLATGPAEHGQRREAVRGRVVVPVEVRYGMVELRGETVDISEAGLRANFLGFGTPPEGGSKVDLSFTLEDGPIRCDAEVTRDRARGADWLLSIRFVDMQEKDQDRIRRRVFQALREERRQ